jgi:ADP-dependent NAD(P)H-hydrate dehydratase / NAD(P)H-hydrate epimerase
MIALLTAEQMRTLDRMAIEELGIPSLSLMETAGISVADAVETLLEELKLEEGPVLILAGTGNNGGDALVAARHLVNRGSLVTLLFFSDPEKGSKDFLVQWEIIKRLEVPSLVLTEDDPSEALSSLLLVHEVVVDGLFGTGLSRLITGSVSSAIRTINEYDRPVVAIDLPSGVNADTGQIMGEAINATCTVTFALPKLGHALYPGRACAGRVEVADIGIPLGLVEALEPLATEIDEDILELALLPRAADSHKGTYGHLLVVAGTPQRPGSALLAARAGLKSGAGLVSLGSCRETIAGLAPALEALMGLSLGDTRIEPGVLLDHLTGVTALVIGPSLVPDDGLREMLKMVLSKARLPVVLDAGALKALGDDPQWLADRAYPTILTPHPGEMRSLTGLDTSAIGSDRVAISRRWAARLDCTIVLKGASTVIADPHGEVGIVLAGNPGMATAGTGDVLAGLIGGLLAQGLAAPFAARTGAYLHAAAGDAAAKITGQVGLTAPDLLDALGSSS